jgi:plasmid stability protein
VEINVATLTIRSIPEDVKQALRIQAAEQGRSLEDALRQMLIERVRGPSLPASRIGVDEIMRRARDLASDEPVDTLFRDMSEKELSDLVSGEFDDR